MLTFALNCENAPALPYLTAVETEEYFGGASRRTLTFTLARSAASLDTLDSLCTDETALQKLTLTDSETGTVAVHDGYTLKLKLGIERVQTQPESAEAPAVYEERIVLKLGRRTYIEEQLHRLGLL